MLSALAEVFLGQLFKYDSSARIASSFDLSSHRNARIAIGFRFKQYAVQVINMCGWLLECMTSFGPVIPCFRVCRKLSFWYLKDTYTKV